MNARHDMPYLCSSAVRTTFMVSRIGQKQPFTEIVKRASMHQMPASIGKYTSGYSKNVRVGSHGGS